MLPFNSARIGEIRRKESLKQAGLAALLGISEAYMSMLEKGLRNSSMSVIQRLVEVTGVPVEEWLGPPRGPVEGACALKGGAGAAAEMKSRLRREHRGRRKAEGRVWELEQANGRLMAEISLRRRFEDIACGEAPAKGDRLKHLEKLAVSAMEEGELGFDEIRDVLRIGRSILRNWLDAEKRAYGCRFADGGEVMASSPGEAALRLRCFDCGAFELGKCPGHGDEKRPRNIMEMLGRLMANGVYDGTEQSAILGKHYGLPLSPRDIANIRYRAKKGLPIPEDVFYMDMRKGKGAHA